MNNLSLASRPRLVGSFSQVGKRNYQEDRVYIDADRGIYIVCDGVGGSEDGALSSQIIVDFLKNSTVLRNPVLNEEDLKTVVQRAHKYLIEESISLGNLSLSTTLAMVVLRDNKIFTVHLGDTKVLWFQLLKNQIWSTRNHSVVQELFDTGIIQDEEQMKAHPLKNRITNALSTDIPLEKISIDINKLQNWDEKDLLLIATDGALENHTDKELLHFFNRKYDSIESLWNRYRVSCHQFSQDNNSALLIQLGEC